MLSISLNYRCSDILIAIAVRIIILEDMRDTLATAVSIINLEDWRIWGTDLTGTPMNNWNTYNYNKNM